MPEERRAMNAPGDDRRFLRLHPTDNLIVALTDLPAGSRLSIADREVRLREDVPAKHKFTLRDVPARGDLTMYGVLVGRATESLPPGSRVTTENTVHAARAYGEDAAGFRWTPPDVSRWQGRTFLGYHRADGSVGTANYWLVIPLVFCENRNVEVLREALLEPLGYGRPTGPALATERLIDLYRRGGRAGEIMAASIDRAERASARDKVFPHVDGIKFLTHQGGCGGIRQDSEVLCKLLAGYIRHPNVAGATVLSLGCQNAQIDLLRRAISRYDPNFHKPLHILEQQGIEGSEGAFIDRALKLTFTGLMRANECRRAPAPLSKLALGLECGGSDGFSGISANPILGRVSDMLVALGGRAVLAEFPELNGVEQELINRCATPALAEKFRRLMQDYGRAAEAAGSGFESNPSPGNIRDGLITDAMKSAGAARKGGGSPVVDVLDYPQPATRTGLSLLCTPGNDVESTTGLAGAGANLIAFTTGLGTPTGNPVAPVVKISSNNRLAERMGDLIDFNAGPVITGELTPAEAAEELLELLIRVASGEYITAAQRLGQDDFIPWKRGVSL